MTQNTLFVNHTTESTLFYGIYRDGHTYALEEHDPGSAQDWRTQSEMLSPGINMVVFCRRPSSSFVLSPNGARPCPFPSGLLANTRELQI